ncbi:MAG: PAS domain-containing sensor histidine kinase [Arcobacteraceae bacterium]
MISHLEYENKKYNKMLNSTLEAVIFFRNQKIVDINDAVMHLLGHNSKENLIGMSYHHFVAEEDMKLVDKNISKRFIGKYEATLTDINKRKFPALIQVKRFEENDSDTTIVTVLDLTDIKQRENILSQSIKMAQMGEMIGNIAHQWRQPLSVITTAASGIKVKKEYSVISDDEMFKLLDSIVLNAEHLSSTIDVFRNFIKEKVEIKEVVIQDRINNALSIIETRLQNEHINLINNINYNEPLKAVIVLGELSQVIINIFNNAIDILKQKDTLDKTIEIDLMIKNKKIVITIEDNGGGIPANIFSHIFEPYFTTKHKSVGTGIGLYMSYDIIVNHMKGQLYAKNTQKGAKFFIELPMDKRIKERRLKKVSVEIDRRVTQRREI